MGWLALKDDCQPSNIASMAISDLYQTVMTVRKVMNSLSFRPGS
jgi:hypothetical protein